MFNALQILLAAVVTLADPHVFCNREQVRYAQYWVTTNQACADSLEGHEAWSKGWAASYTALHGLPAWEDPRMKTADGVFVWDAEFCLVAGLIDLPNKKEVLANYSAVAERAKHGCQSDRVQATIRSTTPEERAEAEVEITKALERESLVPASQRGVFMAEDLFLKMVAWECQNEFYSCMVHFCSYQFCKLPDGRIGMGCQCGSDWEITPPPVQK